ncbi:MAG: TRAP transporter permease [Alphaproteobacteria bacterium]
MQLSKNPIADIAFKILAVGTVIYYLWLTFAGLLPNMVTRPLHLLLALPWIFFLCEPHHSKFYRYSGYLLGIFGIFFCTYIIINNKAIDSQYGALYSRFQWLMAIGLIIVVLEMARRKIKAALPIVAIFALAYAFWGTKISTSLGHNIPFESTLGDLTITEAGLWGMLTGVSVTTISIFIILGAAISNGRGGDAFMALSMKLAGRYRAGAAKVSVLSSALFGSISGSASANVASTGTITIPSMKKQGYPSELAAAVEATASTGGQIMPPLMGAGAFVMVELLGSSYQNIMQAAIIPAILFFVACWVGVDFFARRYQLGSINKADIPLWGNVLKLLPFFFIPFSILLIILFGTTRTPQYAAAIASIFAFIILAHNGDNFDFKEFFPKFLNTCIAAAQQIAMMAAIIICVGIVIGILNKLGLGVKIASMILSLSGGHLAIALILTAITCLILGMEVPTTAAYVICIAVAEQTLLELGMPRLQSHMFVYWYALLSCITPPVCGTVFIAATMANVSWLKVASIAMRLGLGLYLVPLSFVQNPALLSFAHTPILSIIAAVKVGLGITALSYILTGLANKWWKAALALPIGLALLFIPM